MAFRGQAANRLAVRQWRPQHLRRIREGLIVAWDSADTVFDRRPTMTKDMSKEDLVEVLEQLRFGRGPGYVTVRLDRGVRHYLIELLRERH
jgi:hypothetical protein